MIKTIEYDFVLQPMADQAPNMGHDQLHNQAATGDSITISSWRNIWLKNFKANVDKFGDLNDKRVGLLYDTNKNKPAIVLGSGPSLVDSVDALKANKVARTPFPTISALHNYSFLEDRGIPADYYVSLDAGKVVLDDVTEGGTQPPQFYWDSTVGKKLIAFVATDPEVLEKWKGEIYFCNALFPEPSIREEFQKIQVFNQYVSSGGNVGGACVYIAKAIMSSYSVMLCGLDYCFNYNDQFHSYKTKYDNVGQYTLWPDIYGIPRKTWGSYLNFKFFLDWLVMKLPGDWIYCSGGICGSYVGCNLKHYEYAPLDVALNRFWMSDRIWLQTVKNGTNEVLEQKEILLVDLYKDAKVPIEMTVY